MARGDEQFSDADVLAALRAAAELNGNPLTADNYDEYERHRDAPSSIRIIQRFGTWNAACEKAGLKTNRGRPSGGGRWSDAELAAHVAAYLASPGVTGSYNGYQAWAQGTDGAPSGQTVRNRFGGWEPAKKAANEAVAGAAGSRSPAAPS